LLRFVWARASVAAARGKEKAEFRMASASGRMAVTNR
jgi:hypothetical protein